MATDTVKSSQDNAISALASGTHAEPLGMDASNTLTKASQPTPENHTTLGQHVHKWGSYLFADWILNGICGVGFTYWGKFTETGEKLWNKPLTKGFTAIVERFSKNPETVAKSVGKGKTFASVVMGGMFTIPPLLILESKKFKNAVIPWLDQKWYGKKTVENNPKFQASYEAMNDAPKKDFWCGMGSRFVALAPLLAMVMVKRPSEVSHKYYFDHISAASAKVAEKTGLTKKWFAHVPAGQAQERWKTIHEAVAIDFGLGIPYAVMHAFCYNSFVNFFNKKEPKKETPSESVNLPQSEVADMQSSEGNKFTLQHKPRKKEIAPSAFFTERQSGASSSFALGAG